MAASAMVGARQRVDQITNLSIVTVDDGSTVLCAGAVAMFGWDNAQRHTGRQLLRGRLAAPSQRHLSKSPLLETASARAALGVIVNG